MNECSIIWIKWYMSEITSVKLIKQGYDWNKNNIKWEKVDYIENKWCIIWINWYKMRKEDYNWNKMWISGTKWYMSEIIVINL